jgi:chromosome segregation ATPase
LDVEQIKEGLTTAQTIWAVIGTMGGVEGVKWVAEQWKARRDAKAAAAKEAADARKNELKATADAATAARVAEVEKAAASRQLSREVRKDALDEWQAIAARQDEKIDQLEKKVESAEHKVEACEEKHGECENRLAELRRQVGGLNTRVAQVEKTI